MYRDVLNMRMLDVELTPVSGEPSSGSDSSGRCDRSWHQLQPFQPWPDPGTLRDHHGKAHGQHGRSVKHSEGAYSRGAKWEKAISLVVLDSDDFDGHSC